MKKRVRIPEAVAITCSIHRSHQPLRGETGKTASNCRWCSVPIERRTRSHRDYWLSFAWTHLVHEEEEL